MIFPVKKSRKPRLSVRSEGKRNAPAPLLWEAIFSATGQVFYECDPATGERKYYGEVERLLGFTEAELRGCPERWRQRIEPEDMPGCPDTGVAPVAGKARCGEYRFLRKDGVKIWLRDTVCGVKDEASKGVFWVGALQDVTEQREIWMQHQHLQKTHAFGDLAGGIAHDFNNLLTIFHGYTEMLHEEMEPEDPRREYIDEITHAVGRAKRLNTSLLNFCRNKTSSTRVIRLDSVFLDMHRMLRRLVGENIELVTGIGEEPCWVLADARQMEAVLINLVVNACAAMSGGGRLGVELALCEVGRKDPRVQEGCEPGSYVRLTVSDTGAGMDAALLGRILDPHFTTKPGSEMGLGLATCSAIVKQNGGRMTVESTPGKGSVFQVFLPQARPPEQEMARETASGQGAVPAANGEKLLIVEDDAPTCKALEVMLRHAGYAAVCASNGEEALRIIKRDREIRLVISDLFMPIMGGLELARKIRQQTPGIKLVLISGYPCDPPNPDAPDSPFDAFFSKPLSNRLLTHKIREILAI